MEGGMTVGWIALVGCSLSSAPGAGDPPPATDAVEGDVPADEGGDGDGDRDDEASGRRRPVGAFRPVEDPCAGFGDGGLFTYSLEFDGQRWESMLQVPPGPGPFDLVVILHGGDGDPVKFLAQTRFDEGVEGPLPVVLAPTSAPLGGKGKHWNSGNHPDGERGGRDDVAYLDRLTAAVRADVCAQRVLAAGFSNGGQMAMRWGCQGKEPQATLTAAGRLLVPPASCRPLPTRGYIGTKDPVYDDRPQDGPEQRSVVQSFDAWSQINGCKGDPAERRVKDARCRGWQGCGEPTELCIITDLHHTWPSPRNRKKPTETDTTVDGLAWFREVVPEPKEGAGGGRERPRRERPRR
jgi:poly(3-hydroxybutyrate) depolymerase